MSNAKQKISAALADPAVQRALNEIDGEPVGGAKADGRS